jgi:hypothetical protein
MRWCCSSRSFARAFGDGRLTQLEWIDLCCAHPALGGVDLAVEHFPRRDGEYLAQIKKLCADRGLTVAATTIGLSFGAAEIEPDVEAMRTAIDLALTIGAPLLRFSCAPAPGSPGVAWRELIRGLKASSEHAKRANVTLAVQPRPGSMIDGPADVKRAFKECDSAWLRLAAPATVPWEQLARDAVIMVASPAGSDGAALQRFRGFISLEDESGSLDDGGLARWLGVL